MDIFERLIFWRRIIAQTTGKLSEVPIIGSAPTITLSSIPAYKANLFRVRPIFTEDLKEIINLFNKYMFILTNGKLDFTNTWKAPSVSPSQFTGGVKNIYSLSKWLYDIVTANRKEYSIEDLRKIIGDLQSQISGMSFPEIKAVNFKSEVINACQAASTG